MGKDKMTEPRDKLAESLLDALMLHWEDNGNVSADAVRDSCISTLAEVLGKEFDDIAAMVESRALERQ